MGWCPGLWEENPLCKAWGSVGAYDSQGARFYCMHFGLFANVIACLFMAYSCLAITQDYLLLTRASFGSIVMREKNGLFDEEINLDIGLRAVALNNPFTGVNDTVIGFDQFCTVSGSGLQRYVNPIVVDLAIQMGRTARQWRADARERIRQIDVGHVGAGG